MLMQPQSIANATQNDDAPDMMADARPAERLISLLRLMERTVLPRRIAITGAATNVTLDVATQRLQLGVQAGNHFVIDGSLAAAAPTAHKQLRRRARAVTRHDEIFRTHRAELCACAARALLSLCGDAELRYRVEAAPIEEVWAPAAFSALELYDAARHQAGQPGGGPVGSFLAAVRAKMDEAWLISRDGWIMDAPPDARDLATYAELSRTARQLGAWRDEPAAAPQLAYATRPPHEWIWCIASDAEHVAILRCSPLKWAATLSAWTDHAGRTRLEDGGE